MWRCVYAIMDSFICDVDVSSFFYWCVCMCIWFVYELLVTGTQLHYLLCDPHADDVAVKHTRYNLFNNYFYVRQIWIIITLEKNTAMYILPVDVPVRRFVCWVYKYCSLLSTQPATDKYFKLATKYTSTSNTCLRAQPISAVLSF